MENIIVGLIILLAVGFFIRRAIKTVKGENTCNCDGCAEKDCCQQPERQQTKPRP